MKIEMTMSGGFTGIGGKWVAVLQDHRLNGVADDTQVRSLLGIVEQCRSEDVFSKDFTAPTGGQAPGRPIIPDAQTYELNIDGQTVKWSDPAIPGSPPPPAILLTLKNWMTENTPRQPWSLTR